MSLGTLFRSLSPRSRVSGVAAAAVLSLAAATHADTIFATADPGGFFGYIGFDIYNQQSVAARVTPSGQFNLDSVSIWFMSNDFDGTTPQTVTVTLRTDVNPGGDFTSVPSDVILETWTRDIPVAGWNPQIEIFDSATHPALQAGQNYWIVAESTLEPFVNPIWVWSSEGNEFTATRQGDASPWQSGPGAAVGIRVTGTPAAPACPAGFHGTGGVSVQDIFDFLAAWFSSSPSADFNHSNSVTVQDIFDFLAAWFTGCD